jgi:hypothetical protein
MPDMSHSKAYETYAINRFFTDSTNAGLPVTGSIPRGVYMPFHFSAALTGYDSAGMLLHFPSTLMKRIRQRDSGFSRSIVQYVMARMVKVTVPL